MRNGRIVAEFTRGGVPARNCIRACGGPGCAGRTAGAIALTVAATPQPRPALAATLQPSRPCSSRPRSCCWWSSRRVASDAFLTQRNIVNISRQIVTNGFLSLGMLMVILHRRHRPFGRLGAGTSRACLPPASRRRCIFRRRSPSRWLWASTVGLLNGLADRALQPAALHRHAGDDGQPARTDLRLFRHAALSRRTRCSADCSAAPSSDRCRSTSSSSRWPCRSSGST